MDSSFFVLLGSIGIGGFLLFVMFVMPRRKLPEEKERKPLYEERCSANWRLAGGSLTVGGNLPIARIAFYDDFFVIALMALKKISYSEIVSVSCNSGWLSKSITINFAKSKSLIIYPKKIEKILSLIKANNITIIGA